MHAPSWWAMVVWLLGAAAATFGAAAPAPVPQRKVFSHIEHVPRVWLDASVKETWRDCRGCHRYDAQQEFSSPQAECDSCHADQGLLQRDFAAGWQRDLSAQGTRRTRPAFRHHTHGMLECRECHLPKDNDFEVENYEVRTGPGHCARCHEEGRVTAAVVEKLRWFAGVLDPVRAQELGMPAFTPPTAAQRETYAGTLLTVFGGTTGGLNTTPLPIGGNFSHGDHLGLQCADCHRDVATATATAIGTGAIPTEGCKDCHQAAGGRAARPAPAGKQVPKPLASLGAFAHADHFGWQQGGKRDGICRPTAYTDLERGCAACHTYAPDPTGRSERDFPFAKGQSKHTYADCVGCHDQTGWQTGETAAAPRHGSTGGTANGIGTGWQDCTRCHVFGQPDLAKLRPQVEIARWSERTFQFPSHTHPDITTRGIAQAEAAGRAPLADCRECHRARVPELSSRLQQKAFRHDVHLAAAPTAADCLVCHPRASTANDSPSLAADFRTYDLAVCSKCHWGGAVTETTIEAAAPTARAVVAFPHGPHVKAGQQSCSECHTLASDGRDFATKPGAADCSQCHDHQEGGPSTEGLWGAVGSCAKCHHDQDPAPGQPPVASVPPIRGSAAAATDARYVVPQTVFAGFADAQFHPDKGACSDCHKANLAADGRTLAAIELPAENHLFASKKLSIHNGQTAKEPSDCLRCHWKGDGGGRWNAAIDSAVGSPEQKALRREPESSDTRKEFGNSKAGYPGSERAKG
jgi:hypothetical protein